MGGSHLAGRPDCYRCYYLGSATGPTVATSFSRWFRVIHKSSLPSSDWHGSTSDIRWVHLLATTFSARLWPVPVVHRHSSAGACLFLYRLSAIRINHPAALLLPLVLLSICGRCWWGLAIFRPGPLVTTALTGFESDSNMPASLTPSLANLLMRRQ